MISKANAFFCCAENCAKAAGSCGLALSTSRRSLCNLLHSPLPIAHVHTRVHPLSSLPMPFPADKKDPKQANGHIADAVTPEQEREMFGQQSPYASGNELPTAGAPSAAASAYAGPPSVYAAPPSVHGAPPSVYAAPPSARPSSAAPATSSPIPAANPQTQESSVQNRGPQGNI